MVTIYILELEEGKYYVGKTNDIQQRLTDHRNDKGSVWTNKYKFIDTVQIIEDCDDFDEDKYTLMYMSKYGIDNVRGGTYSQIILDDLTVNHIQKQLDATNNKCFRCGKAGHFVKYCPEEIKIEHARGSCIKCKMNKAAPGRKWCSQCFKAHEVKHIIDFVEDADNMRELSKTYTDGLTSVPSTLRHEVWKKYISYTYRKGKCFCCKTAFIEDSNFECGHIISKHNGGPILLKNLRPVCGQCNKSMGVRNMDEFIVLCGFWSTLIKKRLDNMTEEERTLINSKFAHKKFQEEPLPQKMTNDNTENTEQLISDNVTPIVGIDHNIVFKLDTKSQPLIVTESKNTGSIVEKKQVTAFNLKTKEKEKPMTVTNIFRYKPVKCDGNSRYRLSGTDVDTGDGMSKFCNEDYAKKASKELGIPVEDGGVEKVAKPQNTNTPTHFHIHIDAAGLQPKIMKEKVTPQKQVLLKQPKIYVNLGEYKVAGLKELCRQNNVPTVGCSTREDYVAALKKKGIGK